MADIYNLHWSSWSLLVLQHVCSRCQCNSVIVCTWLTSTKEAWHQLKNVVTYLRIILANMETRVSSVIIEYLHGSIVYWRASQNYRTMYHLHWQPPTSPGGTTCDTLHTRLSVPQNSQQLQYTRIVEHILVSLFSLPIPLIGKGENLVKEVDTGVFTWGQHCCKRQGNKAAVGRPIL